MKKTVIAILLALSTSVVAPFSAPVAADGAVSDVPEISSPPGQIQVVTVNAKQNRIFGAKRFRALLNLVVGLRTRPAAFNGGWKEAVAMPDVIILQEMLPSSAEVMARLLRQRSEFDYQVVGTMDAAARFIANLSTVTIAGEPITWADPCSVDPDRPRTYQMVRVIENVTGQPFVAAGVHLRVHSTEDCRQQNIRKLRLLLATEAAPVVVGGDFNRRSVAEDLECDPRERSEPLPWWTEMTATEPSGRGFVDAVRRWHRVHGGSLASEWTRERMKAKKLCDGTSGLKRSRIDYLFARDAVVGDAHADHPGWSGGPPGTRHPTNGWYSDHRWVWGRFVLVNLPRPKRPNVNPGKDGVIDLRWQPVEGATEIVVYRARPGRPYGVFRKLPADATAFTDDRTEHGKTYRYAIAPRGPSGGQGLESPPSWATADAIGPRVVRSVPRPRATGVSRKVTVRVRFDERFDIDTVGLDAIRLFRKDRLVSGRVELVNRRVLEFDPDRRLRKKTEYRVAVAPLRDSLQNRGVRFSWRFTTGKR